MFSIHYSDRVVHGITRADWLAAPDQDVQVVVEWRTPLQDAGEWVWTGVTDRMLWTGQDEYDPFGWGVKYGRWMDWADYWAVWQRAAYA